MRSSIQPARRRRILGVALVVGATGALAACNFLVDAGSYSVGNSSGDASTDGTSLLDTGTTPVDSSTVDSSADVTPAMDSGTPVADTGAPPEASVTCGSGLPTTSPSFKQLVNTCALAVSCSPTGFQVNMSNCITEDFLHASAAFECLTAINDCSGFDTCQGAHIPSKTQCPATTTAPFCTNDGGLAVNCGGDLYLAIALDCTVLGGTCGVYKTDAGSAADCKILGSCSQTDPNSQYCSGNDLFTCVNGVGYGQSCGMNEKCYEDPTNGTNCYINSGSCTFGGADTYVCNGNTVDWCTSINGTGAQFPLNCTTAGLTCNANADQMGNAGCLAPGCTANDVSNCVESCSGSLATVCVGGAPYTFDCKAIGAMGTFTTCTMFTDANLNPYAACQ